MYKKNNRFKYFVWAICLVLAFFVYKSWKYHHELNNAVDPSDTTNISFLVKSGENLKDIAQNLKDKDIISDADTFIEYAKDQKLDSKVVAGKFNLERSFTIPDILADLTDQNKAQVVLTIPEGSTIQDIDDKLAELNLGPKGGFILATKNFLDDETYSKYPFLDKTKIANRIHPLEGYLFPDTYFLNPGNFSYDDLIILMLNNFNKKAWPILKDSKKDSDDTLNMASLVEKEVRTETDLPIVAGILWKRLDENWYLGADASLLYLKDDREINYDDLKEKTPYNLRNTHGLPPSPICNPGLKAITAAANPQKSPYYFYLTKPGNGEVVYAVTNDQQNANKAKYLQ